MTGPEADIYATVATGASCSLNSQNWEATEYTRVVVRSDEALESDSLFLTAVNNVRNYHAEAIASGLSREDVDKAFAQCPCHDPRNAGKQLGRTGCLAILKLNQQEV
jgi:hypothetical protein